MKILNTECTIWMDEVNSKALLWLCYWCQAFPPFIFMCIHTYQGGYLCIDIRNKNEGTVAF